MYRYDKEKEEPVKLLAEEGSYWTVNWKMVQYFGGIDEAIMLGYLCSMQYLYGDDRGVFYRTIPSVKNDTTFDGRRQRKAIQRLQEEGLILTANVGMPKKRYFHVCSERLTEFLESLRYTEVS